MDNRLKYADSISLDRIEKMHPDLRGVLKEDYLTVNMKLPKGVRLRITHTLRTNKEQTELYSLGRTKKGKIVTNAKAGQSIHNYGLAFDIVILKDKDGNGTFETADYVEDKHWMLVVNYFKSKGWSWGGDFKSIYDSPHFEKTFGNTYKTLINKKSFTNNGNVYPLL